MKLETTFLKPTAGVFLGVLTLSIITFLSVGTIIHNLTSPIPLGLKFFGRWRMALISSIMTSIGVILGARRFQLSIGDTDDLDKIKGWTLEFFSDNGVRIKKEKENETTLEPVNRFNQLFNNWFGMELITIKRVDNKMVVAGPIRWIEGLKNSIQSKLRLGVQTF